MESNNPQKRKSSSSKKKSDSDSSSEYEVRRSAITGKKIKMKVGETGACYSYPESNLVSVFLATGQQVKGRQGTGYEQDGSAALVESDLLRCFADRSRSTASESSLSECLTVAISTIDHHSCYRS